MFLLKKSIGQRVCFPIVMISSIGLHFLLLQTGMRISIATYIPIMLVGIIVTLLEIYTPKNKHWSATTKDWFREGTYMGIVHILFPKCLAYFFAILFLQQLQPHELTIHQFWPHHYPVIFQAILMLVLSELIHYWWHRSCHEKKFLWRFHAVHHSVKKLHWINVGRFHLIEKCCQFIFEAVPFLILGVSIEVISLCYLFYSTTGFFQHSNVDVKLGFLNSIISGPELHRWHHSREINESNNNYGTNLIIWDLVFGTWFFPKEREVEKLGLINRKYPMGFLKQLQAPFIKDLDKISS